jgi:hypothetical protein
MLRTHRTRTHCCVPLSRRAHALFVLFCLTAGDTSHAHTVVHTPPTTSALSPPTDVALFPTPSLSASFANLSSSIGQPPSPHLVTMSQRSSRSSNLSGPANGDQGDEAGSSAPEGDGDVSGDEADVTTPEGDVTIDDDTVGAPTETPEPAREPATPDRTLQRLAEQLESVNRRLDYVATQGVSAFIARRRTRFDSSDCHTDGLFRLPGRRRRSPTLTAAVLRTTVRLGMDSIYTSHCLRIGAISAASHRTGVTIATQQRSPFHAGHANIGTAAGSIRRGVPAASTLSFFPYGSDRTRDMIQASSSLGVLV